MGRPAPPELRAALRSRQNPALAVPCPHCGAAVHQPCRLRHTRRALDQPHPSRLTAAAAATAGGPNQAQEQQK